MLHTKTIRLITKDILPFHVIAKLPSWKMLQTFDTCCKYTLFFLSTKVLSSMIACFPCPSQMIHILWRTSLFMETS